MNELVKDRRYEVDEERRVCVTVCQFARVRSSGAAAEGFLWEGEGGRKGARFATTSKEWYCNRRDVEESFCGYTNASWFVRLSRFSVQRDWVVVKRFTWYRARIYFFFSIRSYIFTHSYSCSSVTPFHRFPWRILNAFPVLLSLPWRMALLDKRFFFPSLFSRVILTLLLFRNQIYFTMWYFRPAWWGGARGSQKKIREVRENFDARHNSSIATHSRVRVEYWKL